MGFEDRAYSRRSGSGGWGILQWLLSGSVPLFTVWGIRVRAHSSLVILAVLVSLMGAGQGFAWSSGVASMSVLFLVILLHEFGHCFAARAVGGTADDILMTPLGGLAFASPPRRPLPTFITVACGPLVNLLLMLGAAVVLYSTGGRPAWNPFDFTATYFNPLGGWSSVSYWAAWFFLMNYALLLFNLLPSFPLDGGQMLQSALWRPLGYYKSMLFAATVGVVGAIAMIAFGLMGTRFLLVFVGLSCLMTCVQMRAQLKAAGPWAFQDEDTDYAAAAWRPEAVTRSSRDEEKEIRRAQKQAAEEAAEQAKIDTILEKVGRTGMNSLTGRERKALAEATERQRRRTLERRR